MRLLRQRRQGLSGVVTSQNLHPTHGARFVLTRSGEAALSYAVEVYLPAQRVLRSTLVIEDGKATCEPPFEDAAVQTETLKLARVLKRTPKARLTRWRDLQP